MASGTRDAQLSPSSKVIGEIKAKIPDLEGPGSMRLLNYDQGLAKIDNNEIIWI